MENIDETKNIVLNLKKYNSDTEPTSMYSLNR